MSIQSILGYAKLFEEPGYGAIYDLASGKITRVSILRSIEEVAEGLGLHVGDADPEAHYIVEGGRADRPSLLAAAEFAIAANGVDSVSFPLPAATRVFHDGQWQSAAVDETFEFVTDIPGTYSFVFQPPFPWIGGQIEVIAR